MILKNISINEIDSNDSCFRLYNAHPKIKFRSKKNLPLFPIWLQYKASGGYRIVDGFNIVDSLRQLDQAAMAPAFVFSSEKPLVELWGFRLNKRFLEQNLSIFSLLEILAGLITKCSADLLYDELGEVIKNTGLTEISRKREKLNEICAKAEIFRKFTDLSRIGIKEIELLASISDEELKTLSILFEELALKGSKLTTIVNLCLEIERGFGIDIKSLPEDSRIQHIISKTPLHQRYRRLKSRLTVIRHPKNYELNSSWKRLTSKIGFSSRIEVSHDPDFESDDIQFVLRASSLEELQERLAEIGAKVESSEFTQLFKFV